jgi:hypothetical protein
VDTTSVAPATRPDTRESRALALYRVRGRDIVLIDRDTYEVPSQDGTRLYTVTYGHDSDEACTCPDHTYRAAACVHLLAVAVCRAKRRGTSARKLAALEERYAHELLGEDERCELLDTIRRLRRSLGL